MAVNAFHVLRALITANICLFANAGLKAQVVNHSFQVKYPKGKMIIDHLPFKKVKVLDNRVDTSLFYFAESGIYPPTQVSFEKQIGSVIENYFDEAVARSKYKDRNLLIKLNQCRIPNKQLIKRKYGKSPWGIGRNSHRYIWFDADVYAELPGGGFRKIVNFQQRYYVSTYLKWFQLGMENILDNLIKVIYLSDSASTYDDLKFSKFRKSLKKDSVIYSYSTETDIYNYETINKSIYNRWQLAPIFTSDLKADGVYENFDDFKSDSLRITDIALDSTINDSVFHFSVARYPVNKSSTKPFAIVYKHSLYVNLFHDTYVLLERKGGLLYFYVPWNLPDMYAILSFENYNSNSSDYSVSMGNPVASILSFIGGIALQAHDNKVMKRRTFDDGMKQEYRNCIIDLDNGDIIYSKSRQQ